MGRLIERRELHGQLDVFRDRTDAGEVLAEMLALLSPAEPLVLGVPAGGVPVAVAISRVLGWPMDLAVVSKITLPWNRESGYGAVAFDGTVLLNDDLLRALMLSSEIVEEGIANTRRKVERRSARLRRGRGGLALAGKTSILVDDGLASGFTMLAAVQACRASGAAHVIVAVPTGHVGAIARVLDKVDTLVCANVREGPRFAVADAYEEWRDVLEPEVEIILERTVATPHPP